jgi:Domain of unknown function (DUF4123)
MALDFVDPWGQGWWTHLMAVHEAKREGEQLHVLIDSAFCPGLHRRMKRIDAHVACLFDGNPGDPDALREVSPLLWTFDPSRTDVQLLLAECSGAPMLSTIVSTEPQSSLARRLQPWCVIAVDGQWLNCRFPDTRRLPGIHAALTPAQRGHMTGLATAWHLLARDGQWAALDLVPQALPALEEVHLEARQFSHIMDDAAADEILFTFNMQGQHQGPKHSVRHAQVTQALKVAHLQGLDSGQHVAWCSHWLGQAAHTPDTGASAEAGLQKAFNAWMQENTA